MSVITTIEDLRVLAEKRVPRMFYDYADSGSWTESTYRANESDFQKIKLRQRVAVNMENRSTASTMVGQQVAMPQTPKTGVRRSQQIGRRIGQSAIQIKNDRPTCTFFRFRHENPPERAFATSRNLN